MKRVVSALNKKNNVYNTATKVNEAGGLAWDIPINERVNQICMTGTFGNAFYAGTETLVSEAVDSLKQAPANVLAEAIVKGRNEGFIRAGNILGLVILSQKDTVLFKKVFPEVIKTGNDMEDFLAVNRSMRKFGRAVKTAINAWILKNLSPYYALKYKKQIADAIRIARPKAANGLYSFVMSKYKEEIDLTEVYKEYPQLNAYAEAAKIIESQTGAKTKIDKLKKLITDFKLDVMSLLGIGKVDDSIWAAFAEVMPVMMFLKYLNKLDSEKVFEKGIDLLKKKITVENLQKAKVFPFRLYNAFQNIHNSNVREYLADILDDYVIKYDWTVFNNAGSWLIAPDVSGSMSGQCSKAGMSYSTLSGLFTGCFIKGLTKADIIPWDTCIHTYKHPKKDSVISHIDNIKAYGGGATYMGILLEHLMQNNIKFDNIIFITDNMNYDNKWLNEWINYKKIHTKSKAFLLRLDSYNSQQFSAETAQKLDIYQIFGWSDSVIKFIETKITA